MSATTAALGTAVRMPRAIGGPRDFLRSSYYLGIREVRSALRTPEWFIPGLLMPVIFYFLMIGALGDLAGRGGVGNYDAFVLPLSMMFAVGSGSAGLNMVNDIESGYFDKLLLTPTRRLSLLVGAMGADFVRIVGQGLFVTAIALGTGLDFQTGLLGALAMVALASVWGLGWSGIGFALALRTGSSQATQGVFQFVFPLIFLSSAFAPEEALSGWLRTAATYNPVTYMFRGLRALSLEGWNWTHISQGLAAAIGLSIVTLSLASLALRRRIR